MNIAYTNQSRLLAHKWKAMAMGLRMMEAFARTSGMRQRRLPRWLASLAAMETAKTWGHLGAVA